MPSKLKNAAVTSHSGTSTPVEVASSKRHDSLSPGFESPAYEDGDDIDELEAQLAAAKLKRARLAKAKANRTKASRTKAATPEPATPEPATPEAATPEASTPTPTPTPEAAPPKASSSSTKTTANKTTANKTAANKTAANKTASNKTAANKTASNKTAANKTASNKTASNKVASNNKADQTKALAVRTRPGVKRSASKVQDTQESDSKRARVSTSEDSMEVDGPHYLATQSSSKGSARNSGIVIPHAESSAAGEKRGMDLSKFAPSEKRGGARAKSPSPTRKPLGRPRKDHSAGSGKITQYLRKKMTTYGGNGIHIQFNRPPATMKLRMSGKNRQLKYDTIRDIDSSNLRSVMHNDKNLCQEEHWQEWCADELDYRHFKRAMDRQQEVQRERERKWRNKNGGAYGEDDDVFGEDGGEDDSEDE